MTSWSAFADSARTWPALRWLEQPKVFSDTSALPAPGGGGSTANAMIATPPPAKTVLARLVFTRRTPFNARARPPAMAQLVLARQLYARARRRRNAPSWSLSAALRPDPQKDPQERERLH